MLRISVAAVLCTLAAFAQSVPNDACAGAFALTAGVAASGTTVGAAADGPGACGTAFSAGFVDVFYSYTPAANEACTLTLQSGSGVNRAAVYAGDCGEFTEVACLNGTSFFSTTTPCTWYAEAGVTYHVRLGKTSVPSTFTVLLTTAAPPANDVCSGAVALAAGVNPAPPDGAPASPFDSAGATPGVAPGSPCLAGGSFGAGAFDVWYSYLAVDDGSTTVSACTPPGFADGTQVDTSIEIFSGVCGALLPVACDNDSCDAPVFGASVVWRATAGVTYLVRVTGFSGATSGLTAASGRGTFYLTVTPPPPELLLTASAAPGLVFAGDMVQIDVLVVTSDSSPLGVAAVEADLGVIGGGAAVPFSNLGGGLFRLTTPATATTGGHTVPITATNGVLTGTGSVVVQTYSEANDFCAGAVPLTIGVNGAFSNVDALPGNQPGFDSSACAAGGDLGGKDLFFSFTPACDGTVAISTCDGSNTTFPGELADTQITVYAASSCGGAAALLACNDDAGGFGCGPAGRQSRATFTAVAGAGYLIRVAGRAGSSGTFLLEVTLSTAQLVTIGAGCGVPFPATLVGSQLPYLGQTGTITVTAQPFASGFMLVSAPNLAAVHTPVGACTFYLPVEGFGILDALVTDGAGEWSLTGTFPDDPAFDCFAIDVQAVILGPGGLELTNALRLVMGT